MSPINNLNTFQAGSSRKAPSWFLLEMPPVDFLFHICQKEDLLFCDPQWPSSLHSHKELDFLVITFARFAWSLSCLDESSYAADARTKSSYVSYCYSRYALNVNLCAKLVHFVLMAALAVAFINLLRNAPAIQLKPHLIFQKIWWQKVDF